MESEKKLTPKLKDSKIIPSNQTCEICFAYGSDFLSCIYCNVVCHSFCYLTHQNKPVFTPIPNEWVCFYCEDSINYEHSAHEQLALPTTNQECELSQIKLAAQWRKYSTRKKYLRLYSTIVQLQIAFLVRLRKRKFLLAMQNKLRTIKVKINSLSNISIQNLPRENDSPTKNNFQQIKKDKFVYYIISIHEQSAQDGENTFKQSWRIESPLIEATNLTCDITIDEKFIIAGVSGFQTVAITLFQKSLKNGRDIFLGQASIDLNNKNVWKSGGKFPSMPLENYCYELTEQSTVHPIKMDSSFFDSLPVSSMNRASKRNGSISFDIITTNSMNAVCCSCLGPSLDDFIREVKKLPDQTGFSVPVYCGTTSSTCSSPCSSVVSKSGSRSSFVQKVKRITDDSSLAAQCDDDDASVHSTGSRDTTISELSNCLAPQTPMRSLTIHESMTPSKGNSNAFVMKKFWMCIADGKIYLYQHFGDSLKLMIDLQHFQARFDFHSADMKSSPTPCNTPTFKKPISSQSKIAGNIIYRLSRRNSSLELQFYPIDHHEIFPMKCTFFTSLRLAKGLMTIPSLPMSSVNSSRKEKFDINTLLADLVTLEDMKAKQLASLMEAPMKSTASNPPASLAKLPSLKIASSITCSRSFSTSMTSGESTDLDNDELSPSKTSSIVVTKPKKLLSLINPSSLPPLNPVKSTNGTLFNSSNAVVNRRRSFAASSSDSFNGSSSTQTDEEMLNPTLSLSSFQFDLSSDSHHHQGNDRSLVNEHNLELFDCENEMNDKNEDDDDDNSFCFDAQGSIKIKSSKPIMKKGNSLPVIGIKGSQSSPSNLLDSSLWLSEDAIEQQLMDQVAQDEMIGDTQKQAYGEMFISKVLKETVNSQIQSHHYHPHRYQQQQQQ